MRARGERLRSCSRSSSRAWRLPALSGRLGRGFLRDNFGVTAGEFQRLGTGSAVARTLDTSDGREVATFGVVRLGVPASFYVDQLRDVAAFKRDPAVLQIGVFATPAQAAELGGLSLESQDVDRLRRCRPGDCGLQLSREAIQRFSRDVPWDTPDAAPAANRLLRVCSLRWSTTIGRPETRR